MPVRKDGLGRIRSGRDTTRPGWVSLKEEVEDDIEDHGQYYRNQKGDKQASWLASIYLDLIAAEALRAEEGSHARFPWSFPRQRSALEPAARHNCRTWFDGRLKSPIVARLSLDPGIGRAFNSPRFRTPAVEPEETGKASQTQQAQQPPVVKAPIFFRDRRRRGTWHNVILWRCLLSDYWAGNGQTDA